MLFFSFYLNALSELMAMTNTSTQPRRLDATAEPAAMPRAMTARDTSAFPTPSPPKSAPLARPRLVAVNGEIVAAGARLVSRPPEHRHRPLRLVK